MVFVTAGRAQLVQKIHVQQIAEIILEQVQSGYAGFVVPNPSQDYKVVYPSEKFTVQMKCRGFVGIQSTCGLRTRVEIDPK